MVLCSVCLGCCVACRGERGDATPLALMRTQVADVVGLDCDVSASLLHQLLPPPGAQQSQLLPSLFVCRLLCQSRMAALAGPAVGLWFGWHNCPPVDGVF